MNGNTNVVGFFVIGAGVFAFLAARFVAAKKAPHRNFGIGLAFFSLAFLIWGGIVAVQPTQGLDTYMTVGVLPFVAGFFFLVSAATYDWLAKNRNLAIGIAAIYLIALFVMRTFVFQSEPSFSENGLIYFNAHPLIELMYALAFAGAFLTSLQVVSRNVNNRLAAALTRIFFNLVTICGVILLTSKDDVLQQLNGWVMLTAMLGLFVVYLPKQAKSYLK